MNTTEGLALKVAVLGHEVARLATRIHILKERNRALRRKLGTYYNMDQEVAIAMHKMMSITLQNERLLVTVKKLKDRNDLLETIQKFKPEPEV